MLKKTLFLSLCLIAFTTTAKAEPGSHNADPLPQPGGQGQAQSQDRTARLLALINSQCGVQRPVAGSTASTLGGSGYGSIPYSR